MSASDLSPAPTGWLRQHFWAIAAAVTLIGYALVGGTVFLVWALSGFFVPSVSDPHPNFAEQVPEIVVGLTCVISVVACVLAGGLSLMGLGSNRPHRAPAIVTLVVSALCLIPACWLAVFGGVLLLVSG